VVNVPSLTLARVDSVADTVDSRVDVVFSGFDGVVVSYGELVSGDTHALKAETPIPNVHGFQLRLVICFMVQYVWDMILKLVVY